MYRRKAQIIAFITCLCMTMASGVLAKSVTLRIALREDQPTVELYKSLIEKYEAANPDVNVEIENYGSSEYDEKMLVQMAAGAAPDILYIHYSRFPFYASQGSLLRLGKFFERDHFDMKQFFPSTVSQVTWKGVMDYAIPRETSSLAFFYNTDKFDVTGLPYPNEKTTFDQVTSMGKALTKDTNGDGNIDEFGMYAPVVWYLRNNIMWAFGGDVLSPDYTEFIMHKPEAVAGLQWIANAINTHRFATTSWANRFAVQKSAMMFGGFWDILPMVSAASQFGWDVTYLPQGPAGRFVRTATGAHALWAGTKNAEEAWALLKYLSTKDTQLALAKRGTIIPAMRAAALNQQFLDGPPKNRRVFIDSVAQWGRIDQVTTEFNQMNTEMDKALAPVWKGEKALESALAELKPVMDQLLKQAK